MGECWSVPLTRLWLWALRDDSLCRLQWAVLRLRAPLQSRRAGRGRGRLWLLQHPLAHWPCSSGRHSQRGSRRGAGEREGETCSASDPGSRAGGRAELGRSSVALRPQGSPGGCGLHPVSLPCCHLHWAREVDLGWLLPGFCPRPPPCCLL